MDKTEKYIVKQFELEIIDWLHGDNENATYIAWKLFNIAKQEFLKLNTTPVVGRSELFVCGHPPRQTFLINGVYYCEKCGGQWESIANK